MIDRVLILGAGSAGLLAALTLRVKLPTLKVQVLRSPDIGIIGVGEGTTRTLVTHLHAYLNIDLAEFYREVHPIWKIGIRFLWGPRPFFNYTFHHQFDHIVPGLPRHNGYYCFENCQNADAVSSMMDLNRAFLRSPSGGPLVRHDLGYHLENVTFVNYLERLAKAVGVEIVDGTVRDVEPGEAGVAALHLDDSRRLDADLYVDCSGFRSLLLGKTLAEPFDDYKATLFCDRAVHGGWDRGADEPIKPYTTAETMNSGWCWQIDHEDRINRGYVYSSAFLSDEEAEREFRQKNPKVTETRLVRFRSGRFRRPWVKNVVAIGNSGGFVEPLESTALGMIADDCQALCASLVECNFQPTPSLQRAYNDRGRRAWEAIRNFLAIHYRFNTRLATPFWKECCEKVDLAGAAPLVEYYQENGPGCAYRVMCCDVCDQFQLDGYLVLLIGQKVPFHTTYQPTPQHWEIWRQHQATQAQQAAEAFTAEQALKIIHSPHWQWTPDFYKRATQG